METIISTIEEQIIERQRQLRYRQEEIENLQNRNIKEYSELSMLKSELEKLKSHQKDIAFNQCNTGSGR